ncbi:MAG: hypothetical protein AAGN35_09620 [Bacteroidota bacterium]
MYNKLLRLLLLGGLLFLMPQGNAYACDACGLFAGVTPMDLQSQAGLYFRYRSFAGLNDAAALGSGKTQHGPGDTGQDHNDGGDYRENFHRIALNVRWFLGQKWNLQASIPVTANHERWPDGSKRGAGLSDVTLILNRGLVVQDNFNRSGRIFVGAGVKLPTGWRFRNVNDRISFFDIQGTTESLDFVFQTETSFRFGNNGFLGNAIYRVNTSNANGLRFGNFFNLTVNYFRKFDLPGIGMRVMPFVGTYVEAFSGRYRNGEREYATGGEFLFANLGVNAFVGRFAFRPQIQIPVTQRLNDRQLKSRAIANLNIDFFFN